MPSAIQLIPKWQHPHVETYVYDNTQIRENATSEVDDSLKTIHIFRSDKGVDNTLIKVTSKKQLEECFGKTNYKKYGQPIMMPYASVGNGATAWCMRLMPSDATFANSNLYMYYRVTERSVTRELLDSNGNVQYDSDGVTVKTETVKQPVFQVMFRTSNISPDLDEVTNKVKENGNVGAITEALIKETARKAVRPIPGSEVAADGGSVPVWNCVYIGSFYTSGRGIYGNNYRWRIVLNSEYEKDYATKLYSFEVLSTESGISKVATYVGTLCEGVVNNASVNITDVITNYDDGSYPVKIFNDDSSIQTVYDAYVEFLEDIAATGVETVIPSYEEFDPMFGRYINSNDYYEYYQVVTPEDDVYPIADDVDACTIDNPTGNHLRGGYDGAFSTFVDSTTQEKIYGPTMTITAEEVTAEARKGITGLVAGTTTREAVLYVEAFNGILDRRILASRRTPADYLLDGNYPYEAKVALANFAKERYDALAYIDMGLDIESFSNSTFSTLDQKYSGIFNDNCISKNVQKYLVPDPYGKKKVWVTHTYLIATQFPVHVKNFGIHQAFTKSYARLEGHIKNSVTPCVDLYENSLMEYLALRRFNYIEAIGENVFQRGIQNSSQEINSDLLEESNMHVLFWLKRHIEADVYDSLYNFSDPAERATFKQVEEAKYEHIIGVMVSSFNIRFDMNEWETERQILHCYVECSFRTISKQGLIEIDVNKRQYNVTA